MPARPREGIINEGGGKREEKERSGGEEGRGSRFDHLCWDAALRGNAILFNFSQGLLARQRP